LCTFLGSPLQHIGRVWRSESSSLRGFSNLDQLLQTDKWLTRCLVTTRKVDEVKACSHDDFGPVVASDKRQKPGDTTIGILLERFSTHNDFVLRRLIDRDHRLFERPFCAVSRISAIPFPITSVVTAILEFESCAFIDA
jgi:hypothetical protein